MSKRRPIEPCRQAILAALLLAALTAIWQPARAAAPAADWTGQPNAAWRAIDLSQTAVLPGSPLDMSRFVETPAGKFGRVILDARGRLAFQGQPQRRVVFFGCSVDPEFPLGRDCPDKESIGRWAAAIRRQGYNLFRPHFLDNYLMTASRADLVFDPVALDRFDYLVACLKENGIYLYLDAMTSWRGYQAGSLWSPNAKGGGFKSRIFTESSVRENWTSGVRQLLQHVNPYTKTRLADDPVVAVVLFFNEQNINFFSPLPNNLAGPWRTWLRKKYGSDEAFHKAWTKANGKGLVGADVTLDNVALFDNRNVWETDARARDAGLFLYDLHADLLDWYVKAIRAAGYTGLVTQYDWLPCLNAQAIRNRLPVISMHNYHAHPSDFTSKGSRISQESALAAAGRFFTDMAMTRYGDRPLLITEYGHVFWNRYRYEEGLLTGACAALQDLDGLMVHHNPVVERAGRITPFWAGNDPVGRASQLVTGFAYLRGDVAPSPHRVEITLRKAQIFDAAQYARMIGRDQSKLALLTGVGVAYPDEPLPAGVHPWKPDLHFPLFDEPKKAARQGAGKGSEATADEPSLAGAVAALRNAGILPEGNRTDVAKGLFQSDTGQLLLSVTRRQLQVVTPRLEGVCIDPEAAPGPVAMKQLTVESTSVPASVTAIAVDDRPLAESRHILLVYATDALNTAMEFTAPQRETLVSIGKSPVLVRTGKLKVSLATNRPAGAKAWALAMNGSRAEAIETTAKGQKLGLSIDTGRLAAVTTLFEIEMP